LNNIPDRPWPVDHCRQGYVGEAKYMVIICGEKCLKYNIIIIILWRAICLCSKVCETNQTTCTIYLFIYFLSRLEQKNLLIYYIEVDVCDHIIYNMLIFFSIISSVYLYFLKDGNLILSHNNYS